MKEEIVDMTKMRLPDNEKRKIHDLFKGEACTIRYDPELNCIELKWHGYATSRQFRLVAEHLLIAMRITGTGNVLDDHTHMKMLGQEDQMWILENWLPRACQEGFRTCAVIHALDYFNRLTTRNVFSQIDPDAVLSAFFNSRAAAHAWLLQFSTVTSPN